METQINMPIGKIIYAIDHNTGILAEGAKFDKISFDAFAPVTDVLLKFDGKLLQAKYQTSAGTNETINLRKGNNGFFELSYVVETGVSPAIEIQCRFDDLRRVDARWRAQGETRYKTAKTNKDGSPVLVQFRTVAKATGAHPEFFNELVSAFRTYIRNKANGLLKENKVKKAEQDDKTSEYQTKRREAVNELHQAMNEMLEKYGLPATNEKPTISVEGIQSYTFKGIGDVAKAHKTTTILKKIVTKYRFTSPDKAKETYKSAVGAVSAAVDCLHECRDAVDAKNTERAMKAHPSMGNDTRLVF